MDILLDALIDCLKIFPFIFAIYVFMELIESARKKEQVEKSLQSPFAPLIASGLGLIPECGFAVMCAKFFDKGLIKIGTLISAFIAVSDEGLIVLIASGTDITTILLFITVKLCFAILLGSLINVVFAKFNKTHVCTNNGECIECGEHNEKFISKYVLHPLHHAISVFFYLLALNIIFNLLFYFITEEAILAFVNNNLALQPLLCSLIGMIPNCASSMIIATAYTNGIISFSGLVAGLSANAGVGVLILFKNKANIKKGLLIVALMFISGLIIGYLTMPFNF